MLIRTLLLALLVMTWGCTASELTPPTEPLSQDQLVPMLDKIAETGLVDEEQLTQLTAGLEVAGLMGEAATVQQWPSIENEKQVKQLAKQLSAQVDKQLKSQSVP
ncbi:hypothetical protein [Blastopirellula marina]|uniref:Uncharacterized protein n=1 Tax=Blastopirellula marina TaxID=124 RepID=A0A2S8F3G7_9BACT|nr:hypothetical protein [Blastopirellula marina]PQO26474.1 hypothetical protein C5Y98_30515 [Blastopirellula marina]PQO46891.1 hypothetical protein C5Y93_06995 [Blastopirellula marina]PTL40787.1 hypothetical protein C5Y97_30530 [Blastopirellula marina]